jgi:geranylgeranyl reductase family protein
VKPTGSTSAAAQLQQAAAADTDRSIPQGSHVKATVTTDALVIGAGPGGSAAARFLAAAGHRVILVERDHLPRDKACGDALTPTALSELRMLGADLGGVHPTKGLRISARHRTVDLPWPSSSLPTDTEPITGGTIRRATLDERIARSAVGAGAELWEGAKATEPVLEHGLLRGAVIERRDPSDGPDDPPELITVRARFVAVADGAISQFGRSLGTTRDRSHAQGLALRGYFSSDHHDLQWLESNLDLVDSSGASLPGFRWAFPIGDGTVNIGVGVLSSARNDEAVHPAALLEQWVQDLPRHWEISPADAVEEPIGGRLPLGGSVSPRCGPNWLVIGDAAGSANPFNGDGIEAALRTGRQAAQAIDAALVTNDGTALRHYDLAIEREFGSTDKVGRLMGRLLGQPSTMRELSRVAVNNRPVIEWVFRLANHDIDPSEHGAANRALRVASRAARWIPER